MCLNQFKFFTVTSLLLIIVQQNIVTSKFANTSNVASARMDPLSDVFFEMFCQFTSIPARKSLRDIGIYILEKRSLFMADARFPNCQWHWNPHRPTRIFIHGYFSNEDTIKRYAIAYLERGDFNFIAINWLKGARIVYYPEALANLLLVGQAAAKFIDHLVTLGLNLDDLTCVGHSLGADICGVIGRHLKSGKMMNIMGLDPARTWFGLEYSEHLKVSDAKYVQAIHTNGGFFGSHNPIGHADFYPNWGKNQPSCGYSIFGTSYFGNTCAHTRVHDLFIESLKNTSQFRATKCASYDEINNEKCTGNGEIALMGGEIKDQPMGLYYLRTNNQSPFALALPSDGT